MSNYKEVVVAGEYTEYQRSNKVVVSNELGNIPEITFMEQVIGTLPDGTRLTTRSTKCADKMHDPMEQFNLLNPEDDSIIGTAKYQDVYVLLYSLYRYVADKRDNSQIGG